MFASIRTILHPTDFSEYSRHAFDLACGLARDYAARLLVLHVAEPPTPLVCAESPGWPAPIDLQKTDEMLHRVIPADATIAVEHTLAQGDPAREILRFAEQVECNLIVMGTHGRGGLNRLVMGSVADEVVRHANCPVLTVNPRCKVDEPALVPAAQQLAVKVPAD
jgi:nucleotide-binding universal stress UspA family protein